MKYCLITFRSVTPAQRAESMLRRLGLECSVQRTPRWMEERGCGYCLRVRPTEVSESLRRLREGSIPFSKVYTRRENGAVEEVSQ